MQNLVFRIIYNHPYLGESQTKGIFTDIEKCKQEMKSLLLKEIDELDNEEILEFFEEVILDIEIFEENSNKQMFEMEKEFMEKFRSENINP